MLHRKNNPQDREQQKSSRGRLPDWDDGRTIANMNIDGMPWGDQRPGSPVPQQERRLEEEIPSSGEMLSGRDLRKVIFSATMIGVGVALVFVVAAFLLIQLMLLFWT